MRGRGRGAFTMVEVLVAAGLSTIVLGSGILLWLNGSKGFTKATQHASVREQALLILERIGRDLDGLIVSQEMNTRTRRFHMVQPFELLERAEITVANLGAPMRTHVQGTGIRFHVYHRTEMIRVKGFGKDEEREVETDQTSREEPDDGAVRYPRIVGRYVEYRTVPVPLPGGAKGVDLFRNGKKVNQIPLSDVRFEREDPVRARKTLGASPNAVLKVTIVPRAGIEGGMSEEDVRRQDRTGTALSRVVHLVGFESQYTALLGAALEKKKRRLKLDALESAILSDARVWGFLEEMDEKLDQTPIRYRLPADLVMIEHDKPFESTSKPDPEFARADIFQGTTLAGAIKKAQEQGGPGAGSGTAAGSGAGRAGSRSALEGAP